MPSSRPASSNEEQVGGSLPPALLAASRLIAAGVNVIPVLPGSKKPACRWKGLQSTRLAELEPERVDRYLNRWWSTGQHGLAAVTGEISGIVAVDVDDDAARELVERTCGWPRTVTVKTAKGWHLWFVHPGGERSNGAHRSGVGLDIRGDGGFVVVPPSVHPSGVEYVWERHPFVALGGMWPPASLPDELHELLWPARRVDVVGGARPILTTKYVEIAFSRELEAVRAAPEGSRNDVLNRSVWSVARFIGSGQLRAVEVVERFLTAAVLAGLPEREADATIESALRSRLGSR